ncbi:carbohydrate sulfotransferase 11-like isoform X2 [Mercenaria mercenaria]|uniref:carbohydrate sulfotransferase 11-like isoform X2 n=1 Tax=Mercenaria mercenaria TaxID=6596 RepID=UPI00234EFB81|nr:carbohydrate sulfotransferase 11-like isoform X2 [Mercenaria mercenaria]
MTSWKYARSLKKVVFHRKCLILMAAISMPFFLLTYARRGNAFLKNDLPPENAEFSKKLAYHGEDYSFIGDRFKRRREHLQAQCNSMQGYFEIQNSENAVKEHLTIDKKNRLVYCAIEKIGCTFWKRVFQIISGFRNVTDPFQIQGIRAYEGYLTAKGMPFDRIHYILKHSTKFMFVREPYERLLSGYVDKLFAPNAAYWSFIGTYIVQQFRPNATKREKICGDDVSFEEFVRYFIRSQHNNMRRDAHFVPNFEHCRPCEIDYEYVGKLETFEEDTIYLLKKLKLDDKVKFHNFERETERDAITDAADYVFSMRKAITRCMSMNEALFRAYRKLQIRGIISKEIPFPFAQETNREIGIKEYKEALLVAHEESGPSSSRKSNRKEAFLEAYSTLPHDLIMKLKEDLSIDAKLFDYELYPESLKNRENYNNDFKYFQIR